MSYSPNPPIVATILHTIELAVAFGAAYLLLHLFSVDSSTAQTVTTGLVAAVLKFMRASDASPLPDIVNGGE